MHAGKLPTLLTHDRTQKIALMCIRTFNCLAAYTAQCPRFRLVDVFRPCDGGLRDSAKLRSQRELPKLHKIECCLGNCVRSIIFYSLNQNFNKAIHLRSDKTLKVEQSCCIVHLHTLQCAMLEPRSDMFPYIS